MASALIQIAELQAQMQIAIDAINSLYTFTLSAICIFMQCGFALFEAGISRSSFTIKRTLIKNFLCTLLAIQLYWMMGWAISQSPGIPVFGGQKFWVYTNAQEPDYNNFLLRFAMVVTSINIAMGALAERAHIITYFVFTAFWSAFVHPTVQHWQWQAGGWLQTVLPYWYGNTSTPVQYIDNSGASIIHMMGGIPALIGALILGARTDRYDPETGAPNAYRPHSSTLIFIGGMIIQFGMLAFNALGYVEITGDPTNSTTRFMQGSYASQAVINTLISACIAAWLVYIVLFAVRMQASLVRILCGGITGMVAISACTGHLYPWAAVIIGFFSGLSYLFWSWLLQKLKIDDVTDSFAIFCGGGQLGTWFASLLHTDNGVFFRNDGYGAWLLLWQFIGIAAIWIWAAGWSAIIFGILRLCRVIRIKEEIEMRGVEQVDAQYKQQPTNLPEGAYAAGQPNPIYS